MEIIDSLEEYLKTCPHNFYFYSSHATRPYTEPSYTSEDHLIFGSETRGLSPYFLKTYPEKFYTIPMRENSRCLNLANAASIVLYEAWRQQSFATR